MERKEDQNINSLRMAVELSRDSLQKQWDSVDSLIQRSALIITSIGILFGFLLQMRVGENSVEFCLYSISMVFLILSFVFVAYSFWPLKLAVNTKMKDLKELSIKEEPDFLEQIIVNNKHYYELNEKNLQKYWMFFSISVIFYIISILLILTLKLVQTFNGGI